MKTLWKMTLASATLLSGLAFTACSSSEEEAIGGVPADGSVVTGEKKTEITFAIPQARSQRSTAGYVQDNGTFMGMSNIYLFPFEPGVSNYVETSSALSGNQQKLQDIAAAGLIDQVKTYTNVILPYKQLAFMLYGESSVSDATQSKGELTPSYIATPLDVNGSTVADITFAQTAIAQPALTDFQNALNQVCNNMYTIQQNKAGHESEAIVVAIDSLAGETTSVAEVQLQAIVDALTAAAAQVATTGDAYSNAVDALETSLAAIPTLDMGDLPTAVYEFTWNLSASSSNRVSYSDDVIETGSTICYPASLYYMTNAFAVEYTTVSSASWDNNTGLFAGTPVTISAATERIALNKTVNYAVGRLDVKVATAGSTLVSNSYDGTGDVYMPVVKTDGTSGAAFTLTGVIVGGQPTQVGWDFAATGSTAWTNMIYDDIITSGDIKQATDFTGVTVMNYVLGLPSELRSSGSSTAGKVRIALQVVNNGEPFYGSNSGLIPTGATFYLVGELNPATATFSGTGVAPESVFASDYTTTANLTISSLKNAYATLPDLTTPTLEFSLKVDLTWQDGLVFDTEIGNL